MEEGSKDGRKEIPNGTAVDDENQSKENAQKSIQDGVNANKSNGTAVDDENQSKENENIPEDEPLKDISEKKSNGTDVDDENQSKERGPIQTKGNNSNKENQFQNIAHITDGSNVDNKPNKQNQSISGSDGSDIEIQQPIWMHVTIKQKQYKVKRKDILRILRIEKETENQLIDNVVIAEKAFGELDKKQQEALIVLLNINLELFEFL
eukprot:77593_1